MRIAPTQLSPTDFLRNLNNIPAAHFHFQHLLALSFAFANIVTRTIAIIAPAFRVPVHQHRPRCITRPPHQLLQYKLPANIYPSLATPMRL
jgi:hypothetical protein